MVLIGLSGGGFDNDISYELIIKLLQYIQSLISFHELTEFSSSDSATVSNMLRSISKTKMLLAYQIIGSGIATWIAMKLLSKRLNRYEMHGYAIPIILPESLSRSNPILYKVLKQNFST